MHMRKNYLILITCGTLPRLLGVALHPAVFVSYTLAAAVQLRNVLVSCGVGFNNLARIN
jgi:hypothetical protein